jgi:hypothetical protein
MTVYSQREELLEYTATSTMVYTSLGEELGAHRAANKAFSLNSPNL